MTEEKLKQKAEETLRHKYKCRTHEGSFISASKVIEIIQDYESQLTEKDKQIASYLEMLAKETEKYVPTSKRETIWDKSLSQQLTEKDRQIKELLNQLEIAKCYNRYRDTLLDEKDKQIEKKSSKLARLIANMDIAEDIRTTSGEVVTGFHKDEMGNIILEVADD